MGRGKSKAAGTSSDQTVPADVAGDYSLRISPTTLDKLGVKLYDRASAVVAELVANAYDADAEDVTVSLPLGTELARRDKDDKNKVVEPNPPWIIEVKDNGHGMTPGEAKRFYLEVGRDRRMHADQGAKSREKKRAVMGRKGIGKLAPFGVCHIIEVISSGGDLTDQGYYTTHFLLDYNKIMAQAEAEGDEPKAVSLDAGHLDGTYQESRGTVIRLSSFLPKRVPDHDTFKRQLERRFAVVDEDFTVTVHDSRSQNDDFEVAEFKVPILPETRIDLTYRPVQLDSGEELPVHGEVGMATESYQNEEMAGVRIYARGKIIATTRDFEQPAGYTGEFTTRSYLVGEVHADWLDDDDGEDLIRTDRQDILWSSDLGEALRNWGMDLIKEVGAASRTPRRRMTEDLFLEKSSIEEKARERFADPEVVTAAVDLGKQIGRFAAEDELEDHDYVEGLCEVILSVAPHRALMNAFNEFSSEVLGEDVKLDTLAAIFGKTHVAEVASYGQIAHERVRAITELQEALSTATNEEKLQEILARAPYLIDPAWSAVTKNQSLGTFKDAFESEWKKETGEDIELSIEYANKRPDFILVFVGGTLHIVEIKAPGHKFNNNDFDRLARYVRAFRDFESRHGEVLRDFPNGWQVDLIADEIHITDQDKDESFNSFKEKEEVVPITWTVFLQRARKAHEEFLNAREKAQARK